MKDFARFIPLQNGLTAQFVFSALHCSSGCKYFVTVNRTNGQSYMFTMKPLDAKSWKIVDAPKLPEWIMAMESRLEGAILENMHA
ncbi:MAG TPA: hypothetical protein VNT20_17450 [Flavisolibacter sp.]|jgi:hypothetical protein|nr:hypothetical protein [Flavisolibacter sp.]